MPSVEELATALRAAMAIAAEGASSVGVAQARGDEAVAGFQRVTAGSGDPQPAQSVAHLQRALEHLVTATGLLLNTNDAVEHYITTVLGAGGGIPVASSFVSPSPSPAPAVDPLAGLPVWGAPRPRTGVEDVRTHGTWHGGRGTMERFVSGASGMYSQMSKVFWDKGIWGGSPPLSDAWTHAELQFATFMRASGKRDETISINHPRGPCPACQELISFYLKEGSRLTVRWTGGEQTFVGRQEHERHNAAALRTLKALRARKRR